MTLRKFKIVYHLSGGRIIEQDLDGLSCEAVDAAVQQKLSLKHLIFIAASGLPHISIESTSVLHYRVEEVDAIRKADSSVSDQTQEIRQS